MTALEDAGGVPGPTLTALVASGAFAALLWWGYFDRPAPALEHRGESVEGPMARGRYVRDVYTWAHAPLVAGIILSAAALEHIALHPSDAVPLAFRAMLFSGLALLVAGVGLSVWRAFRAVPVERLAATAVLALVLAGAGSWKGTVVLVAVDAVVLASLVVEHRRIES